MSLDTRQAQYKGILSQLFPNVPGKTLDILLQSIDSDLQVPLRIDANSPTSLIVNIGPSVVSNPESNRQHSIPIFNNALPVLVSGTVTFPSSSGGNITTSTGASVALTCPSGDYCAILLELDSTAHIIPKPGTAAASQALALAAIPTPDGNTLPFGFVVVHNISGTIQHISQTNCYTLPTGAGGSSGGVTALNSLAGALSLVGVDGISVTPSFPNINIGVSSPGLSLGAGVAMFFTMTVSAANATAGAVYSDLNGNLHNVQDTISSGTSLKVQSNGQPYLGVLTLTLVSGTGDASISVSSVDTAGSYTFTAPASATGFVRSQLESCGGGGGGSLTVGGGNGGNSTIGSAFASVVDTVDSPNITFTALTIGSIGNSISLTFNGTTDTVSSVTSAWNTANPDNQVSFTGLGSVIPAANTWTCVGGADLIVGPGAAGGRNSSTSSWIRTLFGGFVGSVNILTAVGANSGQYGNAAHGSTGISSLYYSGGTTVAGGGGGCASDYGPGGQGYNGGPLTGYAPPAGAWGAGGGGGFSTGLGGNGAAARFGWYNLIAGQKYFIQVSAGGGPDTLGGAGASGFLAIRW